MVPIKCPGYILKPDGRIFHCGAKLCEADPGSKIEIVCRRCKKKMLVVVNQDLNGNPKISIKATEEEE